MKIRTSEGEIQLPSNAEIRLSYIYPAPEEKRLQSEYSWWFDIPANANNRALLAFPEQGKIHSVEVIADFSLFQRKATLIVRNVYRHSYRAMLNFFGIAQVLPLKLAELIGSEVVHLGDDANEVALAAEALLPYAGSTQKFTFPRIKALGYIDDVQFAESSIINDWVSIAQTFYTNTITDTRLHNLVPQPFLNYILRKALANSGYNYTGDFPNTEWANRLLLLSNFNADRYSRDGYIKVSGVYFQSGSFIRLSFDTVVEDPSSEWDNTLFEANSPEGGFYAWKLAGTFSTGTYQADNVQVKIFCNGVEVDYQVAGFTTAPHLFSVEGEFEAPLSLNEIYAEVYLYTNPGLMVPFGSMENYTMELIPISRQAVNRYATDVDVANLVSDVTLSDLLHELAVKFTLAVFFDEQKKNVQVDFMNTHIDTKTVLDITPFAISDTQEFITDDVSFAFEHNVSFEVKNIEGKNFIGSYATEEILPTPISISNYAFVENINAFFITESYEAEDLSLKLRWALYTDNYLTYGTGDTAVSSNIETLQMRPDVYESGSLGPIPYTEDMQARSDVVNTDAPRQIPTILYYWGMQPDLLTYDSPFASAAPALPDGTEQDGYYLSWNNNTDKNLTTLAAKHYERLKSRTLKISLSPRYVNDAIELFRANSRYNYVRYLNRQYRPVQLDVVLKHNGITELQLTVR